MFHGTSEENAEAILVQGLRDDRPILHGDSLGRGVYLSDTVQGALIYGEHSRIRYGGRPLPGEFHYVFVCACAMLGLRNHKTGRFGANNLPPDSAGLFCQYPDQSTWIEDESNEENLFSEFLFDPRAVEIIYVAIVHLGE